MQQAAHVDAFLKRQFFTIPQFSQIGKHAAQLLGGLN